jgi:hypothetical protein
MKSLKLIATGLVLSLALSSFALVSAAKPTVKASSLDLVSTAKTVSSSLIVTSSSALKSPVATPLTCYDGPNGLAGLYLVIFIYGAYLENGDTGFAVEELQYDVNYALGTNLSPRYYPKLGYVPLAIDGNFGPMTQSYLENFQTMWDNNYASTYGYYLSVDGIFGPQSYHALQTCNHIIGMEFDY